VALLELPSIAGAILYEETRHALREFVLSFDKRVIKKTCVE
jgi:hypothetical protein